MLATNRFTTPGDEDEDDDKACSVETLECMMLVLRNSLPLKPLLSFVTTPNLVQMLI